MKTTLAQDSASEKRIGAISSQKNTRRKDNGLSVENSGTRNVKLQTSFPPIHFSLSTPARSVDRSHKDHASSSNISRDTRGQKINLPQVDKPAGKIPKTAKRVSPTDKSKLTVDLSPNPRPQSNTPLGPLDSPKDPNPDKQTWLDVSPPKVSPERLSPETPNTPECPTCKKEKRIRNDYDKIIVQSKQDKEVLQQRIIQLEAEMAKCKEDGTKPPGTGGSETTGRCHAEQQTEDFINTQSFVKIDENASTLTVGGAELRKLEEENKVKQDQIDRLLSEIKEFKVQLGKSQENEKAEAHKAKKQHSKLVLDIEELKSQLEKTQKEKQHVSDLEQKESLRKQLETTKSELEKFKKRRALTVAELRKEKDAFLAEIEDLKACTEKVKSENNMLVERIQILEEDREKRTRCACHTSHTYTVSPNTEMLVISHQISQQSTFSVGTGLRDCYCSSHDAICGATESPLEEETIRFRDLYRQLKRERNLLLDVMEIMYARRWFLEQAVPHVKRALRKCGVYLDDGD